MDGCAVETTRLTSAFLLVGEKECAKGGAEEEREDADGGVYCLGKDSLDEENEECWRKSGERNGAEGMIRGLGEHREVEDWSGHGDDGAAMGRRICESECDISKLIDTLRFAADGDTSLRVQFVLMYHTRPCRSRQLLQLQARVSLADYKSRHKGSKCWNATTNQHAFGVRVE
jgi:hypothetical protein